MSIEQRETDAYAERRRQEQAEMDRQRMAARIAKALPWQSMPALRQIGAIVGVTPPPWPQSEDAGQPWPGVDSGAEGGL